MRKKGPAISISVDIARKSGLWDLCGFDAEISAEVAVLTAFSASRHGSALAGAEGEVSVVLADDALVRDLNREYRDKDKSTNVLSFSLVEPGDNPDFGDYVAFGDIILAYETVRREAEDQGKTFEQHFRHLVVHGALHLLGYDHEDESEAEEMESLEIRILAGMGIKNPYTDNNFVA